MATNKKSNQNQDQNQNQQNQGQTNGDGSLMDSATAMLGGLGDNLSNLPDSVKQIGSSAMTRFNRLSTTQKVLGGAALLIGAGYLARRTNLVNWSSLTQMAKTAASGAMQRNKGK